MTIQFIDHALNAVLTGLLYGSEAWIISAFGLYVATHEHSTLSANLEAAMGKATVSEVIESGTESDTKSDTEAAIKEAVKKSGESTAEEITAENNTVREKTPKPPTPILTYPTEPVQIICEPVNWKEWKVSDLRKANLAKTCGIRTKPIGSRRNLPKADLIAQYEQQLKRFTKIPKPQATAKRKRTIA